MNWTNPSNWKQDERAVSPVIGVILMVAVTVILAAVVSMLVLGMGGNVESHPQASFSFDYSSGDVVTITHDGGDTLDAARVNVTYTNATTENSVSETWSAHSDVLASGDISAGNSWENEVKAGTTVRVIWTGSNGDTAVLATYKVPA